VLDVRSPAEYSHAHMPRAISFPLFSNEERKVVGTAYKQESREKAIRIGLDFFGPKMRAMVEEAERLLRENSSADPIQDRSIFVYCWRGGMRSGAVSWLLSMYGFKVYTLEGGYKAFRNWVLSTMEVPFHFRLLGGYTGSGKTEVLGQLAKRGEPVIDLEALACHKGSAFGKTAKPQPSPEYFENSLALELHKAAGTGFDLAANVANSKPTWLEDESQRIGTVNIPAALFHQMRSSPIFFLDISFEERLDYIVAEYGSIPAEVLIECTQRISKRFGPLETKQTIAFFNEGNIRDGFVLLLKYYDKTYHKGLHNRENLSSLLTVIPCSKVAEQNADLLQAQNQLL
jgi:tRNA 2-selenouridine synthase